MSVFSALFDNRIYNYEQAFGAKDITTAVMKDAVGDWFRLYYEKLPTDKEDPCQQLPYTIVQKLTKTMFSEYSASTDDTFMQSTLDSLDKQRSAAVQQAFIGGQCFIKPILAPEGFRFGVIRRDCYVVFGRDDQGIITDIGTAERTEEKGKYYTLLERRAVDYAGYLTIQNKLYQSDSASVLGVPVPLQLLAKYALLQPEIRYAEPLGSIGLIPLRTPMENCIDGSQDAVSVYAPAAGLIHLININEAQINGEFQRGESRIIASRDLLRKDANGKLDLDDHLFVGLDDDPENVGVTIFSPAFREQSFLARKTEYLRNIENIIGIKRGILSEVEAAERTATEITSSAGDYNLTIQDLQQMWEGAVRESIRVCTILGRLYQMQGVSDIDPDDIAVDWGNGILYDADKTWADYMAMVSAGMLKPEIALGWKFSMPAETPEDLAAIRAKYMPTTEDNADGEP